MKKQRLQKALPFLLTLALAGVTAWYYEVYVNWNPAVFPLAATALVLTFLALAVSAVWPGKAKTSIKCLAVLGWLVAFAAVSQGVTFVINNVLYDAVGGAKPAMRVALPLLALLVVLLLVKPWRALGLRAKLAAGISAAALLCVGVAVLIMPPTPFRPIPETPPARTEGPSASTGVSQDDASLIIQNELVTYVIAKENAVVTSIADRAGGVDIISQESPSPFCYLYTDTIDSRVTPVSAALEDGGLRIGFADGTRLDFIVQAEPAYIAFTLDSPIPGAYKGLVFANSTLDYDPEVGDSVFCGIGCAMTWNVDPTYYPDAKARHVMARVLNKTGETDRKLPGSKFAVIYAPRMKHRRMPAFPNSAHSSSLIFSDCAVINASSSVVAIPRAVI